MEQESNLLESDNINSIWLKNVYESLKNLEIMERNAREGCASLFDYLQIPLDYRVKEFAEIQYKNLRFMVTEFALLITKLSPLIEDDELKKLREINKRLTRIINNRSLFLRDIKKGGGIIHTTLTITFDNTLELLSSQVSDIIKKMEHILYIKEDKESRPRW